MWFGEKVETIDCGEEAAKWFSKLLTGKSSGLRLGHHLPGLPQRKELPPEWQATSNVYPGLTIEAAGIYAYLASYMVVNASTVDDLNARLASSEDYKPVTVANFRPNLVVEGMLPNMEDSWTWLRIGERAVLRRFKPCTRCIYVNIDPETAERNKNMEPLSTLKKYRLCTDPAEREYEKCSPVMGVYMSLRIMGHIKTGDPVYINN